MALAFLSVLDIGAVACGSAANGTEDVETQQTEDSDRGGDEAPIPEASNAYLFECEDEVSLSMGSMLCGNGVIHRPDCAGSDAAPCLLGQFNPVASEEGSCRTDGDCDPGFLCIQTRLAIMGPSCTDNRVGTLFACQTSADTCGSDDHCDPALCLFERGVHSCGVVPLCSG